MRRPFVIVADQGEPGATVVVSGPTLRGEDWRFAPSTRVEAWWNTNAPGGPPLHQGPVLLLVTERMDGLCGFQTSFRVPKVASGTYRIVVFIFSSEGFGSSAVTTSPWEPLLHHPRGRRAA